MQKNRISSVINTPKYLLQEYFHRRPQRSYAWQFADQSLHDEVRSQTSRLSRDGIVILPAYFSGDMLARLQDAQNRLLSERIDKDAPPDSLRSLHIIDFDPVFVEAALDDFLLEIIGSYYGKPFGLSRATAGRLLPSDQGRYLSFQWHHDARGKQLKIMILLNGVSDTEQRMTFIRGSHLPYYSYDRAFGDGSRFEKDFGQRPDFQSKVVNAVGPPGTVIFFDTNGLHSGNRNKSAIRNAVVYTYVTWKHFKPMQYPKRFLDGVPPSKRRVIEFNPLHEIVD